MHSQQYITIPVNCTQVPKYDRDASVIFMLIKNVHLVDIINGVFWRKSA